jgi:hypothetical protein
MSRTAFAVLLAVLVASCVSETDPPWQLDHDRIVAVRIEPPAILPGQVARLDALLAHVGGPTTTDPPIGATAAGAPADLYTAVHFNRDHWEIDGPDDAKLAEARAALGLGVDAPVPLAIQLQFPGPLYAAKTIVLGTSYANPTARIAIDGVDAPSTLTLGPHREVSLVIEVADARWFTSCGKLVDHERTDATLVTGSDACTGELVVVGRDHRGGTMWHVIPLVIQL